ncbi:helix-turn-helix domain-containing protein [Micromonospora musae]|uniref:helix-turn-helix domain-containing protein n=1 Tax=Micromonospora musae TaxID=1894970 RepID=UPI0033D66F6D
MQQHVPSSPPADRAAQWSETLGHTFGGLAPERIGECPPSGEVCSSSFGRMGTYRMSGTAQIMRRTARAARRESANLIKLCIPLDGYGILSQDEHQVGIGPGQMAVLDAGRPFKLMLERPWSCALIVVSRDALSLPHQIVQRSLRRIYQLNGGPAAVLASFVASATRGDTSIGAATGRIGEAGLHLIAGVLSEAEPLVSDAAADARRLEILHYIHDHLNDPDLSHDRVAAAHHMAPRTLHRLFEHEPYTVTEYIRLQRLEAARRELTDPLFQHRSIAGVAARWCFVSPAHFTRAFQARYGLPPSMARRAAC